MTPAQIYDLTPFELEKMIEGWESRRQLRLWETSYFAAQTIGSKKVTPKKLMKPFLTKKGGNYEDNS